LERKANKTLCLRLLNPREKKPRFSGLKFFYLVFEIDLSKFAFFGIRQKLTILGKNLKLSLEPNRRDRFVVLEMPRKLPTSRRFAFMYQKSESNLNL
jgi:hypothetical protein